MENEKFTFWAAASANYMYDGNMPYSLEDSQAYEVQLTPEIIKYWGPTADSCIRGLNPSILPDVKYGDKICIFQFVLPNELYLNKWCSYAFNALEGTHMGPNRKLPCRVINFFDYIVK